MGSSSYHVFTRSSTLLIVLLWATTGPLCRRLASGQFICESAADCVFGTCNGVTLECDCQVGYVGERCQDECPLRCFNGGSCVVIDLHGGLQLEYECECPDTHNGWLCQNWVPSDCTSDDDCSAPFGTCGSDSTCACETGRVGSRCEMACPLDCQNGGTCRVIDDHGGLDASYVCDCLPAFKGGLCETSGTSGGEEEEAPQSPTSDDSNDKAKIVSIVILVLVLVAGVAGAAAWGFCRRRNSASSEAKQAVQEQQRQPEEEPPLPSDDSVSVPSIT